MCNAYSESGQPCGVQRCEEYESLKQERDAYRRAMDLLGVPAQALKDPDKAPPLHVSVALARKAMEVLNGNMAANGPSHGPA